MREGCEFDRNTIYECYVPHSFEEIQRIEEGDPKVKLGYPSSFY